MAKVAILTMQRSFNYGAILQAYALQQTIKGLGVDCELLDLLRPENICYKHTKRNSPLAAYARVALEKEHLSLLRKMKASFGAFLKLLIETQKRQRFHQFEETHLAFSRQSFCCSDDLYAAELDYDAYVTGSDQVWNPTFPLNPEPYFLTFAAKGTPRIAYAPSFGVSEINEAAQSQYRQWLRDISYLSIRETQGAELINQLTGRIAQVVLDPTLLLTGEEWKKIAKRQNAQCPYIFCYSLGDVPGVMKLCYHVQGITGYPIYKIGPDIKDLGNRRVKAVLNAGPQEFLGYIMNAALVITNSFHGTVFSLNMQKPFFAVPSPVVGANSRDSRLLSILELFSLTDRLYRHMDKLPSRLDFEIVYNAIHPKLEVERAKSLSYLRSSILGAQK